MSLELIIPLSGEAPTQPGCYFCQKDAVSPPVFIFLTQARLDDPTSPTMYRWSPRLNFGEEEDKMVEKSWLNFYNRQK